MLDKRSQFWYNISQLWENYMIVHGSINYTFSGRKRKATRGKKVVKPFKELKVSPTSNPRAYHSVIPKASATTKKEYPKAEGYTVSIAYNKGAYQVIPDSDIKYIGK
jgi:hypothetical protein